MKGKIVKLVVGDKVWEVSRKMANATIMLAKQKYKKEGAHAIVGVEKDGIISLLKDTYTQSDELHKAVQDWENGGYKCHYVEAY